MRSRIFRLNAGVVLFASSAGAITAFARAIPQQVPGTFQPATPTLHCDAPVFPHAQYDAGFFPISVAIADLDGDSYPDLAVANHVSNTVSVLLSRGDATFTTPVTYATGVLPFAVAIADLDGDGDQGLAVANFGSDTVSVLRNLGGGTFASHATYPTGPEPASVAIGDLDGAPRRSRLDRRRLRDAP